MATVGSLTNAPDRFRECRSGVAQIRLVKDGVPVGGGTGFLISGGLVTNSHVVRAIPDAVAQIRFEDMAQGSSVRVPVNAMIVAESPEAEKDYAFLRLDEPEFSGRYRFSLTPSSSVEVGQRLGFLGYPFSMEHLTCHLAYVSAIYEQNAVVKYQLDGSVNSGNSGGPLIDLDSGAVVGIITRAYTGLIEESFRELIEALRFNQTVLSRQGARIVIGGVDPVEALLVSQAIMERIALALRRSANVGIGVAFSSRYVRDAVALLDN